MAKPFMVGDLFGLSTSEWTAVGTITLAAVTVVLVVVTGRYVGLTRKLSEQSEANLRIQLMPIVVYEHRMGQGEGRSDYGETKGDYLNLINRGRAVAFNVDGTVVRDDGELVSEAHTVVPILHPQDDPPGRSIASSILRPLSEHEFIVEYMDPVGTKYRTRRRYVPGAVQEGTAMVERWDDDKAGWVSVIP